MNKVDTKIRHITKRDANLFAELGFLLNEAERYQVESLAHIELTRRTQNPVIGEVDALDNGTVILKKKSMTEIFM